MNLVETFFKRFVILSAKEKVFVLFTLVCSFCITCEYSISRSISGAIFVSKFGFELLPYAWIATIPLNFLFVSLYNKFLPKYGIKNNFKGILFSIIFINLIGSICIEGSKALTFFHVAWKEVYILILYQQLWSIVNSTIKMHQAKYLYGIIFGIGGIGGAVGGIVSAKCVYYLGTQKLFLITLPILILLFFAFLQINRIKGEIEGNRNDKIDSGRSILEGIKTIYKLKNLMYLVVVVVLMQIGSSITEYLFNYHLQQNFTELTERTQFYSQTISIINVVSMCFQFFGSGLLISLLGIKNVHMTIPCILACNGIASFFLPAVSVLNFSFITIKSFEYSLFGVVKEMVYIPLGNYEKYLAKSIIDILAYRTAKVAASLVIILFQVSLLASNILFFLGGLNAIVYMLWVVFCFYMFKKFAIEKEFSFDLAR